MADWANISMDLAIVVAFALAATAIVALIWIGLRPFRDQLPKWPRRQPAAPAIAKLPPRRQRAQRVVVKSAPLVRHEVDRVLPRPPGSRLDGDTQWHRVSGLVVEGISRAEAIRDLQQSAAMKVDAATYGLQRMTEELAGLVKCAAPSLPSGHEAEFAAALSGPADVDRDNQQHVPGPASKALAA